MTGRGKVLRDPHAGPGLLMMEGRQYQFQLEGVWKSDVPPKPGLVVDVEVDSVGHVTEIVAVPESQLSKEQAEIALAAFKNKGAALASGLVARFGLAQLVAAALLILSWSLLTAVSVQLPFLGKLEISFWQVLGYLNSGNPMQVLDRHSNPSSGFYGLLAVVALAGPFIQYFWKNRRAMLCGLLPLAFMALVAVMVRSNIQSSFAVDGPYANMQRQAQDEAMNAVSLGFGSYLSILVSLYFAALSTRQFLAAKGNETKQLEKPQKAAA